MEDDITKCFSTEGMAHLVFVFVQAKTYIYICRALVGVLMCWVNMSGCHMAHPCMLMFVHVLYMGASVLMPHGHIQRDKEVRTTV